MTNLIEGHAASAVIHDLRPDMSLTSMQCFLNAKHCPTRDTLAVLMVRTRWRNCSKCQLLTSGYQALIFYTSLYRSPIDWEADGICSLHAVPQQYPEACKRREAVHPMAAVTVTWPSGRVRGRLRGCVHFVGRLTLLIVESAG